MRVTLAPAATFGTVANCPQNLGGLKLREQRAIGNQKKSTSLTF